MNEIERSQQLEQALADPASTDPRVHLARAVRELAEVAPVSPRRDDLLAEAYARAGRGSVRTGLQRRALVAAACMAIVGGGVLATAAQNAEPGSLLAPVRAVGHAVRETVGEVFGDADTWERVPYRSEGTASTEPSQAGDPAAPLPVASDGPDRDHGVGNDRHGESPDDRDRGHGNDDKNLPPVEVGPSPADAKPGTGKSEGKGKSNEAPGHNRPATDAQEDDRGKAETKSKGKSETKSKGKAETKSKGKAETKSKGKSENVVADGTKSGGKSDDARGNGDARGTKGETEGGQGKHKGGKKGSKRR